MKFRHVLRIMRRDFFKVKNCVNYWHYVPQNDEGMCECGRDVRENGEVKILLSISAEGTDKKLNWKYVK